jgi:hypothetical protein
VQDSQEKLREIKNGYGIYGVAFIGYYISSLKSASQSLGFNPNILQHGGIRVRQVHGTMAWETVE